MWSSTPDALREALAQAEELSTEQLEVEIRVLTFGGFFSWFSGVFKGRMIFLLIQVWLAVETLCAYVIF